MFAAAFVIAAALVVWLSLRPMSGVGVGHIDKVEHFAAYAGLVLLGFAARGGAWGPLVAGIVVFGAGVEVLQAVLPTGRTGSVLDGLANTAGACTAWGLWTVASRRRAARN